MSEKTAQHCNREIKNTCTENHEPHFNVASRSWLLFLLQNPVVVENERRVW
jgi:hypothetical protein